jgi:hypothetical protein
VTLTANEKVERTKYGAVAYAQLYYDGKMHYLSYQPNCSVLVCSDCGLHCSVDRNDHICNVLAQCWCGWGISRDSSVQEEFGLEFEDV